MFMDRITEVRYKTCRFSPGGATMPVPFPGLGRELGKHPEAYREEQRSPDNQVPGNQSKGDAHPDMEDTLQNSKNTK